jgi:hypothetical protein
VRLRSTNLLPSETARWFTAKDADGPWLHRGSQRLRILSMAITACLRRFRIFDEAVDTARVPGSRDAAICGNRRRRHRSNSRYASTECRRTSWVPRGRCTALQCCDAARIAYRKTRGDGSFYPIVPHASQSRITTPQGIGILLPSLTRASLIRSPYAKRTAPS